MVGEIHENLGRAGKKTHLCLLTILSIVTGASTVRFSLQLTKLDSIEGHAEDPPTCSAVEGVSIISHADTTVFGVFVRLSIVRLSASLPAFL